MHVPVMLPEVLEYLAVRPDGLYIDMTAGLGGHTGAIAQRLTTGKVLSLDRDAESMELARANVGSLVDRIDFKQARFSELSKVAMDASVTAVDGLLADLGVSRFQLTTPERGFSLMAAGPVDMRMDRSTGDYRSRDCEYGRRTFVGQSDFRVRRGKEVATNSQSDRSRTANSGYRSFSGGDRRGRAADRSNTSGYANLHGSSVGGQRRAG